MSPEGVPAFADTGEEIAALIATLHATEQRLEELTGGEVDTAIGRSGGMLLLPGAQKQQRDQDAASQAAILNALPAHIALLDTRGFIVSTNETWRRFGLEDTAHSPGHEIGVNYLDICDSARGDASSEAHRIAEGCRSVLAGRERRFSIEYPCSSPAGRRLFLLSVTPLAEDRPNGAVVMHVDVTDERRIEESLLAVEGRFRQMAEHIRDAFFLRNPDGSQMLYMSPAYEEIFGRTCESLYANPRSWMDAIHPGDRPGAVATIDQTGSDGYDFEYRIIRPGGEVRWIHVQGFPVLDAGGNAYRIAGVVKDITQRKQASDELLRAETSLRQAQKMDAVGQLTGGIAHDFNNLLTVVLGNASLLVDSLESNTSLCDLARMIEEAARRGGALTHRLLAFARQQPLQPTGVDLNALIVGMEVLLRRTLGEGIDIIVSLDETLPFILADAGQVENALLNLVINARDAMPNGGELMIETAAKILDADYAQLEGEVEPGSYAMLSVTDTGTGMSPEVQERVFEPFFTTKAVDKGTGLGLSMVFGFAKQSGGHIKIYSELGVGTTVRLYLPWTNDLERPVEETSAPHDAAPRGNKTILVVEDAEMVRVFAVTCLKSLGYAVREAGDGTEALALLDRFGDIDLLFTDIGLPGGMNGRQLAEEALRRRPDLKVLYTSGYSAEAIVHGGRLDRGVQLLSKPYHRRDMALHVQAALAAVPPASLTAD